MKALFPILFTLAMPLTASGQEPEENAGLSDKVRKAILEFNKRKENPSEEPEKEVKVVLPAPGETPDQVEEAPPVAIPVEEATEAAQSPAEAEPEPTLVTGKPPAPDPTDIDPDITQAAAAAPVEAVPEEAGGLGIRVEQIRDGKGGAVPGRITLKASFPAKTLSTAPGGWILEKSPQAPAFLQEVTLRPGKKVSLSISPHVLTPAADGETTFGVVEPGFSSSEGYRQSNTVSAILGNSIVQLDRDALLLGNAISDLDQLLSSLPKPEAEPENPQKP